MITSKIFPRFSLPTGKKSVLYYLLLLQAFLLVSPGHLQATLSNNDPALVPIISLPWERVEKVLADRFFSSGDELFQLLFILYKQEKSGHFRLEKETLAQLKKKLSTLFPLDGCELIELQTGRVIFHFSENQQVAIPHTWWQASLQITDRLVLAIEDNPAIPGEKSGKIGEMDLDTESICFSIQEGSLQLHFSFFLKMFGGQLRDAEGTTLVYQINETKKISRLQLIEKTLLTDDSLKITSGERQWIDILHVDFPGSEDIGINDNRINFLGTEVELLPDHMIRIGTDEPQKNEEAWAWFSSNIKLFQEYAQTGKLTSAINYTRSFGYNFEERQITMTMGFYGTDEKQPGDTERSTAVR